MNPSNDASSPVQTEPGRLARPVTAAAAGWTRWLPGLQTARRYELAWLPRDLAAGLVLTTMLVPVGIAYAVASGVPGIYGLYATIVPLLAYALFGPSRILVLGPDSSLAAVILAVVLPLSGGDPMRAVALAGMMAVVSGAVCIAAGLARLGFITELLSKPIRYGYMNGIALTVLISQAPKLFGFSIESEGPVLDAGRIVVAVMDGATNWSAFAVGAGTLAAIEKGLRKPELLVGDLSARRDISDVRDIVRGYRQIAERAKPGTVFQLCSGKTVTMKRVLDLLLKASHSRIPVKIDKTRLRKADIPILKGDNRKAVRELGYAPKHSLQSTVSDTLNYWRDLLATHTPKE